MELRWSALPAAATKPSECWGQHKLLAHMHNKLSRILIWAEVCPNLVVLLKNTCGHAPQVVPVGLFGTLSTPDFGAACIHPHWVATRDRKWNDDPSSAANTAYGRKRTALWKEKCESCKRRAGNKRTTGGSRVAGAEAEGPRGKVLGRRRTTHSLWSLQVSS